VPSPLALARPDIVALQPYEHAAWEPQLERLHANELPWRSAGDHSMAGLNRYPEPQPQALIDACVEMLGLRRERLAVEFTQHTSDEMYRHGRGWAAEWTPNEAVSLEKRAKL